MRATEDFPLDHEGRLSVKKSGLYYIYAQVNYLDEHDVNAFQVTFVTSLLKLNPLIYRTFPSGLCE